MGRSASTETTLLISHRAPVKPALRFPLGLFPEPSRPYLELIRLDKVRGILLLRARNSSLLAADGNNTNVLALWYVTATTGH